MASAKVHAALFATINVWALAFTAIDRALVEVAPFNLVILRHLLASALLLAVLVASADLRWPARKDWGHVAFLGFLAVVAYHVFLYLGQLVVPPGTAALLVSTLPVWVAVLAAAVLAERLTASRVAGVSVALLGVAVVILFGTPGRELTAVAVQNAALILLAPISWALFTVYGKRLAERYTGLEVAAWSTVAGTGLVLAGGLPFFGTSLVRETAALSATGWATILYLGILSTAVTTVIWFVALRRAEAGEVAVYVYLMPVLANVWAALLVGQPITIFIVAGGALIVAGIALTQSGSATATVRRGLLRMSGDDARGRPDAEGAEPVPAGGGDPPLEGRKDKE